MSERTPREILREADRQREIVRGAEWIQERIKKRDRLVMMRHTGVIGRWWRDRDVPDRHLVEQIPRSAARALHEALTIVAHDAAERARDLEAQVTTREAQS